MACFYILCFAFNMKPEIKKKLERIFMGEIPKSLPFINDEITYEALKRQGVEFSPDGKFPNVLNVNFVTFIQDIEEIKRERNAKTDNDIDVETMMSDLGILIRSVYIEYINDSNNSNEEKLLFTFFIRKILITYDQVYHIHIIDEQPHFVNELTALEDFYYNVGMQELAQQQEQQVQSNMPFEISSNWPYAEDKLDRLCKELHEDGFIEHETSFKQVFNANSTGKCNWLKTTSSLLYFLWLLLDKGRDKPTPGTIHLLCDRFLTKGKSTTKKTAQSIDISRYLDTSGKNLKGNYSKLDSIFRRM